MVEVPPKVDKSKFLDLIRAEEAYKANNDCPKYENPSKISSIARQFLVVGSTSTYTQTGTVYVNDGGIKNIIACGYGSVLLKQLAENTAFHFSHRKNHVALFVLLCTSHRERIVSRQFCNYLGALLCATLTIFLDKIYYPFDLSNFLDLTKHENWQLPYKTLVSTWYTRKCSNILKLQMHCWKLNGNWTHREIWNKCSRSVRNPNVVNYIEVLINEIDMKSYKQKFDGISIVDNLGDILTISEIANSQVTKELEASDKILIFRQYYNECWLKECSPLEILLLQKKYAANNSIVPDINISGFLIASYIRMCKTKTQTGQRVCVIPSVSENESKKAIKYELESKDLATALLEDLMRNRESKMFTTSKIQSGNMMGFFDKQNAYSQNIIELQKTRYHPAKLIEMASQSSELFDSFVIVAINGKALPYAEIFKTFQAYQYTINHSAKLIIVGVDRLEQTIEVQNLNNVLMISGVDEGTSALLWQYMSLE